jgi:peptidyl-prolyl cis-trans isomerase A (cyclophilin A)
LRASLTLSHDRLGIRSACHTGTGTGCPTARTVMADCDPVTTSPIQTATATLHTNRGDIKIALFGNHAPKTVANFVGLAQGTKEYSTENASGGSSGPFYDGVIFHRVINGFMIQGGDPTGTGRGDAGYKFADEFHPELQFDKPYLLAMANAGPGTNGSQFFITVGQTPHLNRKHTIFGEVVDGDSQHVVDAIATTATGPGDRPSEPVVIESITIS